MSRKRLILGIAVAAVGLGAAVPPLFLWWYVGPRTARADDGLWHTYMKHGEEKSIEVSRVAPEAQPTRSEVAAAAALVEQASRNAAEYRDFEVATTEGGFTISNVDILGRPEARMIHVWNPEYMSDGTTLDPSRPESLIFHNNGKGKQLVGVMFMAMPGEHGAQIAGPLTRWHYHPAVEFCMDEAGIPRVRAEHGTKGGCPPGMSNGPTPEMMHVWLIDNPHGVFAHLMALPDEHVHGHETAQRNVYAEFLHRLKLWVGERV